MDISIRDYIKNNFKNANENDIKNSIETSIKEQDEEALPGMGVFFELTWQNSDENLQKQIINNLKQSLK